MPSSRLRWLDDLIDVMDVPIGMVMKSAISGDLYEARAKGYWKCIEKQRYTREVIYEYIDENGYIVKEYEETPVPFPPSWPTSTPTFQLSPNMLRQWDAKYERQRASVKVSELLADLPVKRGRPAKVRRCTRTPTRYNTFVKHIMPDIIREFPAYNNTQRMAECAARWQLEKLKNDVCNL